MKVVIILLLLSVFSAKVRKNILVQIFPGAKSHSFVLKELFDYSKSKTNEQHEYYIVVHESDAQFWKGTSYNLISYGEIEKFSELFTKALQQAHDDPVLGYTGFHTAVIYIYESFIGSKVIDRLRDINFDMLIGDIPNFLYTFLKNELKIENAMFISPPCTPSLFYGEFEWNPSYLPSIGTPFTEEMNIFQRFMNSIYSAGLRVMLNIFQWVQVRTFHKAGYVNLKPQLHELNTFIMLQCPDGIAHNFPKPPNMVTISAVTPRDARPLTDKQLDAFLNKFEKNIYISQGTIMNVIRISELIDLFNNFPAYGFILSVKSDYHKGIEFPKNVFTVAWVNQNDLLGDRRLHTFISHGGINSVMESLYHLKPVIALGLALDQLNTASYVKQHEFGVAIVDKQLVSTKTLIKAIEDVLTPGNKYLENTKKYQRILRSHPNPREVFHYWFEYGLEFGYSHLHVKAYSELYSFQLYNYDLAVLWLVILYLVYFIVKKIIIGIFCSCKPKKLKEKGE
jgi:2-hydroxyacylsphingosine 1-beta-galactosyltransferase